MTRLVLFLFLALTLTPFAGAKAGKSSPRPTTTRAAKSKPTRCVSCSRSTKGRIARSAAAKRSFQRSHPCPSTGKTSGACPGYVVDHVVALKRGGADAPRNMQWQTTAAAKAKDKVE
jgi:hypothetical protein